MKRLGPFELVHVVGTGGMGEVWRGVHSADGHAVAIKVVTRQEARQLESVEAFRREVRAVAALDHPAIIGVYDLGEVPAGTLLQEGSPYLVMEYATRGSLEGLSGRLDWRGVRRLLLGLLDALAHAHARGVVHRDIKAANVLLTEATSGAALKLSDFGLAHAIDRSERQSARVAGTPVGMAPEQFRGDWRAFGPWTDLYGVGVLAWELITGAPPFASDDLGALMQQHLLIDPPRLVPLIPVPEGVEPFLRRLLMKRPWDRYQRAADAAWALSDLGEATGPAPDVVVASPRPQALTWWDLPVELPVETWDEVSSAQHQLASRSRPPLPESWRRARAGSIHMHGAGLGLVRLRTVPFVGRDKVRDRAWTLLHEVRESSTGRGVLIRGPAGIGKSRLASWLCERAEELGGATVLTARHEALGGPGSGLPRLVAHALHVVGLEAPRDEIERRLRAQGVAHPGEEADALVELIQGTGSRTERFAALERLLQRTIRTGLDGPAPRPVVLFLDDVQWGLDALEFARWFLRRRPRLPVLLVLTARDEALAERLEAADLVEALSDVVEVLTLGPLGVDAHRGLVRGLLGLSGELADEVEERTGGSPLFAVQLVGDLVERGVLELSESGWRLRDGERTRLPDDLYAVWGARLDAALEELPDHELLELAAALGQSIDAKEWAALSGQRSEAPIEALARVQLIVRSEHGFSFVHGMLREALQRRAEDGGRLERHHRRCAAMLREMYGESADERVARHHLAAEDLEEALDPLARAASRRRDDGAFPEARDLLDRRLAALRALDLPPQDPRLAEGWVVRAALDRMQGRWDAFDEGIARVVPMARRNGQIHVLAEAVRGIAEAARQRGRLDEGHRRYTEALGLYRRCAPGLHVARLGEAHCRLGLGDVHRQHNRFDQAEAHYRDALALYEGLGDLKGVASAHRGLGGILRQLEDHAGAAVWIRKALAAYEELGARLGVGNSLNDLGDFERYANNWSDAEALYRRAAHVYASCGSYATIYPTTNLALLWLEEGRVAQARTQLEAALVEVRRHGITSLLGGLHVALAACAASEGNWREFDDELEAAIQHLEDSGDMDRDNAWPAERAAEIARRCGQAERADRAQELADAQWTGVRAISQDRHGPT
ncbi:MAG: protein kinase [Proteobacteria bacterium]|nr:protein kinase [Pseudomonadota bacterium]